MLTSLFSSLPSGRNKPKHKTAQQLVASPRGLVSNYPAAQEWLDNNQLELSNELGYYRVTSMSNYLPEFLGAWRKYRLAHHGWMAFTNTLLTNNSENLDTLTERDWLDQWFSMARDTAAGMTAAALQGEWGAAYLEKSLPEHLVPRMVAWLWRERTLRNPVSEQQVLSTAEQEVAQRYALQGQFYADARLWQDFPEQSYLPDLARMAERATEYYSQVFPLNRFSVHMQETGIVGEARKRNTQLGFGEYENAYGELSLKGQVRDEEWVDVEDYVTRERLEQFQQPLQELQARMGRIYLRYALDTTYQRLHQLDTESIDYDNLLDDVENLEIEPTLTGNHEERLFLSTIFTHLDYNPEFQIGNLAAGEGYKVHYPTQVINDLNLVRKGLRGTGHILYMSRALLLAPSHMRGYGASQFRASDNAYFFASPHVLRAIKDLEQLQLFAYDALLVPQVDHYPALEQSLALGAPALERVALRSLEAQVALGKADNLDQATRTLMDKANYFSRLNQPVFPHLQALYDKLDGQDHVGLRILADGEAVVNNRPTPSTYFQLHTFQEHQLWFQPWLTVPEMVEYPQLNDFFVAPQTVASSGELSRLESVVHGLHSLRLTPQEFVQLQTTHTGRKFLTKLIYHTGQSLLTYTPLLLITAIRNDIREQDEEMDDHDWLVAELEALSKKLEVNPDFKYGDDELQRANRPARKSAGKAGKSAGKATRVQEPETHELIKNHEIAAEWAEILGDPYNYDPDWDDDGALDEFLQIRADQLLEDFEAGRLPLPEELSSNPLLDLGDEGGLRNILPTQNLLDELGLSADEFNDLVTKVIADVAAEEQSKKGRKASKSDKSTSKSTTSKAASQRKESDSGIVKLGSGQLRPGETMAEALQRMVDDNRDVLGDDFELDDTELDRLSREERGANAPYGATSSAATATSKSATSATGTSTASSHATASSTSAPNTASSSSNDSSNTTNSTTTLDNPHQLQIEGSVLEHTEGVFFQLRSSPYSEIEGRSAVMAGFVEKLPNAWQTTHAQRFSDALPPLQAQPGDFTSKGRKRSSIPKIPRPDYVRDALPQTALLHGQGEQDITVAQETIDPHTWVYWKHAFALPTSTTPFQMNESEEAFYAASQEQRARPWQQASLRVKAREYDLRGQLLRLRQLQNRSLVRLTPASYMEWDFVSHYYTGFQANGWVARDGAIQPLRFEQITNAQEAHALWMGHAILATKTAYQQFMSAWSSHNRDTLTSSFQGRRHEFAQAVTLALDPQARAQAQAARQAFINNEAADPQHLLDKLRTPELDAQGQPLTRAQSELIGQAQSVEEIEAVCRGDVTNAAELFAVDLNIYQNRERILEHATSSTDSVSAAAKAQPSELEQAYAEKLENYINVLTQVGENLHNVNTLGLTKIAELQRRFDANERGNDVHYKHLLGLTRMHLETALREEANLAATDWQLRLDRARSWARAWHVGNLAQQAYNIERFTRSEVQKHQHAALRAAQDELADKYRASLRYLKNPEREEFSSEYFDLLSLYDQHALNRNYGVTHTGMGNVLRRRYRADGMGMQHATPLPHELHEIFFQRYGHGFESKRKVKVPQLPKLTHTTLRTLDGLPALEQQLYHQPALRLEDEQLWDESFWMFLPYRTDSLDYNWGLSGFREKYGMHVSRARLAREIVEWLQRRDWVLTPSRAQQFAQDYMQHSVQDDYHRTQSYAQLSGYEQQVALRTLQHDDMISRLRLWAQRNWREIEDNSRRIIFSTDYAHAPARLIQSAIGVHAVEENPNLKFSPSMFEEERLGLMSDIRAYEASLAARLHHLTRLLANELSEYTAQFLDDTSREFLLEVAGSCIIQDIIPFLEHWTPAPTKSKAKSKSRKAAPPLPDIPEAVLVETIQRSVVRHLRVALSILAADETLSERAASWERASNNLQALLNITLLTWSLYQVQSDVHHNKFAYSVSRTTAEQPYVRAELDSILSGVLRHLLDSYNLFNSANLINSATEMAEHMWQQGSELRSFIELYAPTMQETPLGRQWLKSYLDNHTKLLGVGIDLELALQNIGKSELGVKYRHLDRDEERHYRALRTTRLHTRNFTLLRSILINQRWAAQGLQYQTEWDKQVRLSVSKEHTPARWSDFITATLGAEAAGELGVNFDYRIVRNPSDYQAEEDTDHAPEFSFKSVRVHADPDANVIQVPRVLSQPVMYAGVNQNHLNSYHPDITTDHAANTTQISTHLSYNGLGGVAHAQLGGSYHLNSSAPRESQLAARHAAASYAQDAQQLENNAPLEEQLVREVAQATPATPAAQATTVDSVAPATSGNTPTAVASHHLEQRGSGERQVTLEIVEFTELEPQREPLVRIEVPSRKSSTTSGTSSTTSSSTIESAADAAATTAGKDAAAGIAHATAGYATLLPESVQVLYERHLQEVQLRSFSAALAEKMANVAPVSIPHGDEPQVFDSFAQAIEYFYNSYTTHINQLLINTPVQGEIQVPGLALLEAVLVNRHLAGQRALPPSKQTSIADAIFRSTAPDLDLELEALNIADEHLAQIRNAQQVFATSHGRRIQNFGNFEQTVDSALELLQELRLYTLLRLQLQGRINLTEQYWDGYQSRVRRFTMLHHLMRVTQVFYNEVNKACYYLDSRVLAPFLAYGDVSPSELQYLTYRIATETPISELSLTFLSLVRGCYVFNHLQPISTTAQQQVLAEQQLIEQGVRWVGENYHRFSDEPLAWDYDEKELLWDALNAEREQYLFKFYPSLHLSKAQSAREYDVETQLYFRVMRGIQIEAERRIPVLIDLPTWILDEYEAYADLPLRYPHSSDLEDGYIYVPAHEGMPYPEYEDTDWSNSFPRVMRKVYDPEQWHIKQASMWLDSYNYLGWEHYPNRLPQQAQLATWGSPQLVTRLLPHKMIEGLTFQYLLRFEQYHDLESWLLQKLAGLEQVSDFTTMSLSKFWNFNEQGNWGRMWNRLVGAVLDDSLSLEDCFMFQDSAGLKGFIPIPAQRDAAQPQGIEITLSQLQREQEQLAQAWEQALPACTYNADTVHHIEQPSAGSTAYPNAARLRSKKASKKAKDANSVLGFADEMAQDSVVGATGLVPAPEVTQLANRNCTPWVNYFHQLETSTLLHEELGHATLSAVARELQQAVVAHQAQPHLAEQSFHPYQSDNLATDRQVLWGYREPSYLSAPRPAEPELALRPVCKAFYNPLEYTELDMHVRKWQNLETGYASLQGAADLNVNELVNSMNEYVNLLRVPVTNLISDLDWTQGSNEPQVIAAQDAARRASVTQALAQHQAQEDLMLRRAQYLYALRAQLEGGLHDRVYLTAIAQLTPSLRNAVVRMGDAEACLSSIEVSYVQQQLSLPFYNRVYLGANYSPTEMRVLTTPYLRSYATTDSLWQQQGAASKDQVALSYPLQLHWMGYAAQYACNLADYRAAQRAVEQAVSNIDPSLLTEYHDLLVQVTGLQDQRQRPTWAVDEVHTGISHSLEQIQAATALDVASAAQVDYHLWSEAQFELAEARVRDLAVRALYLGGLDESLLADLTLQAQEQRKSLPAFLTALVKQARKGKTSLGAQLEKLIAEQHGILPLLQAVTRLQVVGQRFLDLRANLATADLFISEAQRAYAYHTDRYLAEVLTHPQQGAGHQTSQIVTTQVGQAAPLAAYAQPAVRSGLSQLPWDSALRLHDQGMTVSSTLSLTAVADMLESWSSLPYHVTNLAVSENLTGWYFKQLPLSYHLDVAGREERKLWDQPLSAVYPYLTSEPHRWWEVGAAAQATFSTTLNGKAVYYPQQGLQALVEYYATHANHFQAEILSSLLRMGVGVGGAQGTRDDDGTQIPLHTRNYKLTYPVPPHWAGVEAEQAPLVALATRTEWLCTLARHSQHPAARQALPAFDRWQQEQVSASLLKGAERDLLEVDTQPLATGLSAHAEQALRMQQDPLYADLILQRRGLMNRNLLVLENFDSELASNIHAYLQQLPTQSAVLYRDAHATLQVAREDDDYAWDEEEDTSTQVDGTTTAPSDLGQHLVHFQVATVEQEAALAERVRELAQQAGIASELSLRTLSKDATPTRLGNLEVESVVDTVAAPDVLPLNLGDYTVRYTRAQIDYQLLSELQIILAQKTEQDYLTTQVNRWVGALIDHNYRVTHQVLANVNDPSIALNFIQHYNLTSHRWLSESANSFSVLVVNDYLRLLTEIRHSVNVIQDLLRAVAAGSQPAYAYFLTQLLSVHYAPEHRFASDWIKDGVLPALHAPTPAPAQPAKRGRKPAQLVQPEHKVSYAVLEALSAQDLALVQQQGNEANFIGKGRAFRQLTSYLNFQRYNLLGVRNVHPQDSVMQLLDGDGFTRSSIGSQNTADQWLRLLSIAQAVSPLQVAAYAFKFKVSNLTSHESTTICNNIIEHVNYHAGQPWVRPGVLDKYPHLRLSASSLVLPQATVADADHTVRLRSLYRPYQLLHYQRATLTPSTSQFDYQGAMAIILKGFFPVHLRGTSDQYATINWKDDFPDVLGCTNLRDYLRSRPRQQFTLGGANFADYSLFQGDTVGFAWNYDQDFVRSYAVDLLSEPARNSESEQAWRKEHGLGLGHEIPPARKATPAPQEVDLVAERTPRTTRELEARVASDTENLYYTIFNYELSDYLARGVYGLPWAPRRELHDQLDYYTKVMGMGQGYFDIFTHLQRPTAMYVRQDELRTSIEVDYIVAQAARGDAHVRAELEAVYTPNSPAVTTAQENFRQRSYAACKYSSTSLAPQVRIDQAGFAEYGQEVQAGNEPSFSTLANFTPTPRTLELHEGAVVIPLPEAVPTSWGWVAHATTPTPAQQAINRWLRAQARNNYLLRLDAQSVHASRQQMVAEFSRAARKAMRSDALSSTRYYQTWRKRL